MRQQTFRATTKSGRPRPFPVLDLDAYESEERREEASHLAGLSASERAQFARRLTCLHLGIAWRDVEVGEDGRLHADCQHCGANVSRSAFVN